MPKKTNALDLRAAVATRGRPAKVKNVTFAGLCRAYCAVGMRRGTGTVLRPSVFLKALRALAAGFRQTRPAGDPLQQGGVVVMGRDGVERYRYVGEYAGDHAEAAAIVDACRRAA